MGKISPVSAKYIIHTHISIDGIVDRPDVIGAIFGQTEGLLGTELELRELQRSGRIGRIEVNLETRSGKTEGEIIIPSSLDKVETVIVGAALETIQRIGPCNAKVRVQNIEDVRVSKRNYVLERAKELLRTLTETVLPDSQEITDEVAQSVRMMEIVEYGKDRLSAGPAVEESEEIIVVEGRADVLNLLKYGIKNAIALNGTSVPPTMKELCDKKVVTVFVDGDRGGDLILRGLMAVTEIDYVVKAPDGKEVEELTKKEIHKALRSKMSLEQAKIEIEGRNNGNKIAQRQPVVREAPKVIVQEQTPNRVAYKSQLEIDRAEKFKKMLDDLIGTRGAYILDQGDNLLGKVPTSELAATIGGIKNGVHTLVVDGSVDRNLVSAAERAGVKRVIGMDSRVRPAETRVEILTSKDF
ncbi:MAG: DNA primase [Candidatus Woesearchaeota archaeon]|nr:MAG: DNA primase [Candidatus Woesearchaeota archaeon]